MSLKKILIQVLYKHNQEKITKRENVPRKRFRNGELIINWTRFKIESLEYRRRKCKNKRKININYLCRVSQMKS